MPSCAAIRRAVAAARGQRGRRTGCALRDRGRCAGGRAAIEGRFRRVGDGELYHLRRFLPAQRGGEAQGTVDPGP